MKKVHVLGIAPYEGMKHLMRQAAARRENVELDIFMVIWKWERILHHVIRSMIWM